MTTLGLMILVSLVANFLGSCAHLSDAVHNDIHSNQLQTEESEDRGSYMPFLCSQHALSSKSPSVDTLRPADISVISAMGLPLSYRTEAFRIVSRLAELMSRFNPDVIALPSLQHRSLLEQAEELSVSLFHHQATGRDWNLVLLFVPVDSLCVCSSQAALKVEAIVQEVEAALQILQKLHNTLIHTVVWSVHPQQDNQCQCVPDNSKRQQLQRATLIKELQDSLHHLLADQKWHSRSEDFSVLLQATPLITELISDSKETTVSDSNELAIQLWTNMLQPLAGESGIKDNNILTIPCLTEEQHYLRTQRNSPINRQETEFSPLIDPVMGTELPCTDRNPSPTVPTSVHELRPGDIKVVAAVGDSLTAGNGVGAKTDNLLLVMNEYRGLSWSIGGDKILANVTTLPNILREFNPSLTGFAKGIGGEETGKAFLNQAVPGAKSGDMVSQVQIIVNKMKNDLRIDFENDWKVITMFIGGNDLCDFCTDSIFFSARNVVERIRAALDILHKEVPRAIVNLIEMLHMVPLREVHNDESLGCPTWFVKFICPCILKPKEGSVELQRVIDYNRAYQHAMQQLIDSGRYDTHDNFTVVLQPFLRQIFMPKLEDGRPDRSYFSPDCFHLSQKAHSLMARALWNNMLEPVGNKTVTQDFTTVIDLTCPSETSPFFRTAHNSNYTFPGPPPTSPPFTNWGSDFFCVDTAPSNTVPTSVHRLRPGDINVVAALGDSITAGFGAKAKNLLQLRTESRGVSWSIGGDDQLETVTTLPNILKKFNPSITGMSIGKTQNGFNMAVSGAKIAGIPGQVRKLIDAMKTHSAVNFEKDWKLVTLFIGGNDLCQYCNDRATLSPQNYTHHLMTSLDMLYKEVPRVMVNVLEILEIEGLRKIKKDTLGCSLLQKFVCTCYIEPGEDSPELAEIKRINREIQTETERLVFGDRYDGKDDFTVVLQPFFRNTIVPLNAEGKPDVTYFSVDCFHFSERGHADMAVSLWNNMLEPVGYKQTYNTFSNERNRIKCPTTEHPYIFTVANSFPSITTTLAPISPAPTIPTTATPCDPSSSDQYVPLWAAAVLAVAGLLIGWAVTWLLLSCREKRNKKKMETEVELKGTGL